MMLRIGALFVLVLAATLLPFSARALVIADVLPIHGIHDMEIVDGIAYVVGRSHPVGSPTLRILDLSDPAAPVEVGSFYTPYGARDVEVVGGRAYLTTWGEVRIVDVSDPAQPVEIGSFSAQCDAADVEVVGNYAYLVDQPLGTWTLLCRVSLVSKLRVIDVSNPAAPTQVSETDIDFYTDIEAVEGVVYAADHDGLELIDVSDPAAPVTVGVVPELWAWDIDVADGYVYAANYGVEDPSTGERYGLEVNDVKDPANPFRASRAVASGDSIDVVDGLAYLSGVGLQVVDVSSPAAPKRRGSIYAQYPGVLGAYDGYAYLDEAEGLNIIDLSLLDTPTEVGWAEVVGPGGDVEEPNDVEILGSVAYLAVGEDDYFNRSRPPGEGGLRTYDITDPTAPAALGGIDTADIALDVELAAGLAFVAAGVDGLRIFDVTNPSAPVAAGALALPGFTAKLEVVGTTAYVVDRGTRTLYRQTNRALRVIDVSNAAAPAVLGAVEFTNLRNGGCRIPGIAVVQQYAYVACDGLLVVDVSNPAHPVVIFRGGLPGDVESSIQLVGDRAYISSGTSGSLYVFDISDPARPVRVYEAPGAGPRAIVVEDGFAYSAGYGLAVHDLGGSLPAVLLGGYPGDRGGWNGLAIADGLAFGAAGSGYLQVVDLGPEYKHARSVEIAIRAEGEPALVNLSSRGVIGVAILGAADFDVAQIDRSTLRFGPSSAAPAHKAGGHLEDINGDARPDLLSHYRIADIGISEADKSACVSGQTSDGTPILGCGTIGVMLPREQANASGFAD
jgi:hypothetical protein